MAFTMRTKTTGGKELRRFLTKARTASGASGVQAGFFATARYPNGKPVTNVAVQNEFGVPRENAPIPERPFMRQAAQQMPDAVLPLLKERVDSKTMVVDRRTAGLVGLKMVSAIQSRITDLREPPNAPLTILQKGSSNPLIDTGFMRQSVTYHVRE